MQRRSEAYANGLKNRQEVLGAEYVARSMASASSFMKPFQELVTEWCWGSIWNREGLERRTRSLLNIAMLTALNRPNELKLHVGGALRNGVTPEEIQEALLQAAVYCGIPAALDAFKIADAILREEGHLSAQEGSASETGRSEPGEK